MPLDTTSTVTNYCTSAVLTHVVGKAYEGAVRAATAPIELALSIATSIATSATVYLLMVAGKLLIAGTFVAVEKTAQGVRYLFFSGAPPQLLIEDRKFNDAFDDCDIEMKESSPRTPISPEKILNCAS